jgi:hypothetical protein
VLNELRSPRLGLGLLILALFSARAALAAEDAAATVDLATDAGTASEVFACITSRGEEPTGGPYIYVRPIGCIGSVSSSLGRCLK